jgi:predicted dehydrogenase
MIIDKGALGEVYQISFRMRPGDGQGLEVYLERQAYFQTMERFLVHETAIHFVDVFRYLMGEVESVYADLTRFNPVIKGEGSGYIVFQFRSGARGLFDGNRLVDHVAENRRLTMGEMLIEGSEAVLRIDGDGGMFLRKHSYDTEMPVAFDWENRRFAGDSVYMLLRHVVQHILAGAPAMNTAREYLKNLQIEDAIYQSSEASVKVTL